MPLLPPRPRPRPLPTPPSCDTNTSQPPLTIPGFGTLYATHSLLSLRSCGGGIVAWKGTNTTFPNTYGAYLAQNTIAAENDTVAAQDVGQCALGRPWNSNDRTVFLENYLDATIRPQGYVEWADHPIVPARDAKCLIEATNPQEALLTRALTKALAKAKKVCHFLTHANKSGLTLLAEYKDYGPGFNASARVSGNITTELTDEEAAPYRWPKDVFRGPEGEVVSLGWIDDAYLVGPMVE
ncbi:MAG: hypothetical protein Q9159_003231 [Coniocarpon cinnabarinum]